MLIQRNSFTEKTAQANRESFQQLSPDRPFQPVTSPISPKTPTTMPPGKLKSRVEESLVSKKVTSNHHCSMVSKLDTYSKTQLQRKRLQ